MGDYGQGLINIMESGAFNSSPGSYRRYRSYQHTIESTFRGYCICAIISTNSSPAFHTRLYSVNLVSFYHKHSYPPAIVLRNFTTYAIKPRNDGLSNLLFDYFRAYLATDNIDCLAGNKFTVRALLSHTSSTLHILKFSYKIPQSTLQMMSFKNTSEVLFLRLVS